MDYEGGCRHMATGLMTKVSTDVLDTIVGTVPMSCLTHTVLRGRDHGRGLSSPLNTHRRSTPLRMTEDRPWR